MTLLLILYTCLVGDVADAAETSLNLSLRSAVDQALSHNPEVQESRERVREAEASRSFAISQLFPNLGLSGSAIIEKDPLSISGTAPFGGDPYSRYQAQLKLIQPLYQGGALLSGLSFTRKEKSIRELDLEAKSRDLIVSVIQAFYNVFTQKQVLSILHDTQAVEKESLVTSQQYFKIGRGPRIDVLQTKAQIALLNPQIANAENQMKAAVSQLATLLHENQANTMELVGSLATVDAESVRAFLLAKKPLPELVRGETQISQFEDKKDVSLAPFYPSLNLEGTYGQTSTTKSQLFSDYSTGWTVGLYLNIPIFSGLSSINKRRVLDSQSAQLDFAQQKLVDTLIYNQTQVERDLDTAGTVLSSSKEAASYAKDSLKEAQKEFKHQTISYLQLLTSQQSFLNAQTSYIQAKGNYITTLARYCAASGIPILSLVDLLEAKKDQSEDL
jgi:hypothetical protein